MDSITVKNYRCFGEKQTAILAPITLLVGENSTGKTSLMAMVRALWDASIDERVPNFKEEPYDLGSFDEIIHRTGGRGSIEEHFTAGFGINDQHEMTYDVEIEFGSQQAAPVPIRRRISRGSYWIDQSFDDHGGYCIIAGSQNGKWSYNPSDVDKSLLEHAPINVILNHARLLMAFHRARDENISRASTFDSIEDSPEMSEEDYSRLVDLLHMFPYRRHYRGNPNSSERPFASAPTRSQPRRTYNPARVVPDAEGDYAPMYLAWLALHEPKIWEKIKGQLEEFGRLSGLFNDIRVRRLGTTAADPFQVQVRKFDGRRKGPFRNLVDVGYGVSQALPLIVELLRDDSSEMLLLQQPEVHLHPSAAAALGTLFGTFVTKSRARERRLLVETHSDAIIDRVRISVREGLAGIRPEDVSILYFERRDLGVEIHSLSIDQQGNLLGTPPGYRRFFMEESRRFFGIE
ncbi:MAG: AAA family ATPase [bacterium]|nr:AAA family ATPase [bacterium]